MVPLRQEKKYPKSQTSVVLETKRQNNIQTQKQLYVLFLKFSKEMTQSSNTSFQRAWLHFYYFLYSIKKFRCHQKCQLSHNIYCGILQIILKQFSTCLYAFFRDILNLFQTTTIAQRQYSVYVGGNHYDALVERNHHLLVLTYNNHRYTNSIYKIINISYKKKEPGDLKQREHSIQISTKALLMLTFIRSGLLFICKWICHRICRREGLSRPSSPLKA